MGNDYRNSVDEANLKNYGFQNTLDQLNKISQNRQEQANRDQESDQFNKKLAFRAQAPQTEGDQKIRVAQGEADIQRQSSKDALQDLLTNQKNLPAGAGASEEKGGASITKPMNMGVYDLKRQQFDTTQVNKYATALKPLADASGAAADLERVTNRDGKGGVFTNPDAKLTSAGKINSALPDSILGLTTMFGINDPSAAEERKAIARYRQSVGVSLGGARGMSPAIQAGIQNSMGQMASGDPDLMAKGIRGAGRITGSALQTAQSGFTPEVRGQAHMNSGMSDPMDFYKGITPEKGPAVNQQSPLPPNPGNVNPVKNPMQGQPTGQQAPPPDSQDPIAAEISRRAAKRGSTPSSNGGSGGNNGSL